MVRNEQKSQLQGFWKYFNTFKYFQIQNSGYIFDRKPRAFSRKVNRFKACLTTGHLRLLSDSISKYFRNVEVIFQIQFYLRCSSVFMILPGDLSDVTRVRRNSYEQLLNTWTSNFFHTTINNLESMWFAALALANWWPLCPLIMPLSCLGKYSYTYQNGLEESREGRTLKSCVLFLFYY